MSSSFSTTPAKDGGAQTPRPPAPERSRTVITWALLAIWAVLISFGLVSLTNPTWLDKLARTGQESESYAYKHYGDTEMKNGNFPFAVAQYQRALEIRPGQADVQVNLAIAYIRMGNLSQGRSALLEARQMGAAPGLERSISFYLGEISERENRPDEAVQHYLEALSQGARPAGVYQKLGAIRLAAQDYPGALEAFERVLAAQTDPGLPYRDMVRRIEETTEEELAAHRWLAKQPSAEISEEGWRHYDREAVNLMHASDPEIAKTHNHLGLIHYRMGNIDQAIAHFEQSLAIWPGNVDATRNLPILRAQARGPRS